MIPFRVNQLPFVTCTVLVKYQKWLIDQVFPDGALIKTASKA